MTFRIDELGAVVVFAEPLFQLLEQVCTRKRNPRAPHFLTLHFGNCRVEKVGRSVSIRLQAPIGRDVQAFLLQPPLETETGNLALQPEVVEQRHELCRVTPGWGSSTSSGVASIAEM